MAQGMKYNDDIKEKAFALLAVNNNLKAVARELKLPESTVRTWRKKWLAERDEDLSEDNKNLVELRAKKKEKFVNNAWRVIESSMTIAKKRVERAVYFEQRIDAVAEAITKHHEALTRETGIAWDALCEIVKELQGFKTLRLGEVSTLLGVMYDKQALINKEPTGMLEVKKFEDF